MINDNQRLNEMQVSIYTDGACSGNPGVGGWAWILMLNDESSESSSESKIRSSDGRSGQMRSSDDGSDEGRNGQMQSDFSKMRSDQIQSSDGGSGDGSKMWSSGGSDDEMQSDFSKMRSGESSDGRSGGSSSESDEGRSGQMRSSDERSGGSSSESDERSSGGSDDEMWSSESSGGSSESGGKRSGKMRSGRSDSTTNNQMELMAVLSALQFVQSEMSFCSVVIYSDSTYVVTGANQWIKTWRMNNWINSTKKLVKNQQLWMQINQLLLSPSCRNVVIKWIKGHSVCKGNNLADQLAVCAMRQHVSGCLCGRFGRM